VLPTERIARLSYGRRTAALRDFGPTYVADGSSSTHAAEATRPCLSASPRKRPSTIILTSHR
jgi:hypothetical protein